MERGGRQKNERGIGLSRRLETSSAMTSSVEPNFESVALGKQIIDLDAEVWREVKAGRYQHAAELRDQREVFQRKLNELGNPTVIRNVNAALGLAHARPPLLSRLEDVQSAVDPELLGLIGDAPLPPRWLIHGIACSYRATIAKQLNIESLGSPYFRAKLPVFSSATFGRATIPTEWLNAAIRETARTIPGRWCGLFRSRSILPSLDCWTW